MIYNGHFEPNFLFARMYKSSAEADQNSYRALWAQLEDTPEDVDAIAGMVRLLHHYIFDRAGIHIKKTEDEPRLPLWFSEKPEAAEEMYDLIEKLPEELCVDPLFHHVYLSLQAQNCFISGEWGGVLRCCARLLGQTADLEKFAAEAHISYFDALEFRCKVISNACLIQSLNDAPEEAAALRNTFRNDYSALRGEYDKRSTSSEWKRVYDSRWLELITNRCFYYHTMPGGSPYFRRLTDEERTDPNTAFYWIYGSSSDFFHPAYPEVLENGQVMLYAVQPASEQHMPRELYRMARITPPFVFPDEEELPDPSEIV